MKLLMLRIAFIFVLLLQHSMASVAQNKDLFEKKVYQSKAGVTLPYRILYPENYNPKNKYPLVLFLHGAGERGNDNEAQLVHGASLFLAKRTEFPAIVVFPQCPKDRAWSSAKIDRNNPDSKFDYNYSVRPQTPELTSVMELLAELRSQHKIDKKRLYIMGLSMGGMGTFEAISRHPKVFAAAIPICGGGDPAFARSFAKKVPIWVFHGTDDTVVRVDYSRQMVKAAEAAGGEVKYSEYPGVKHNSWDNAFAEPGLLQWLFENKK